MARAAEAGGGGAVPCGHATGSGRGGNPAVQVAAAPADSVAAVSSHRILPGDAQERLRGLLQDRALHQREREPLGKHRR